MSCCDVVTVIRDVNVIEVNPTMITIEVCPPSQNQIVITPTVNTIEISPVVNTITISPGAVIIGQGLQRRVVELVSLFSVPSNGTLYMGSPPTSAAPLVIPSNSLLKALTLSVDTSDSVAWDLEVQDATTLAILATLTLQAGDTAASVNTLTAPLLTNQQLLVRLRGSKRSAFSTARATIETTQT